MLCKLLELHNHAATLLQHWSNKVCFSKTLNHVGVNEQCHFELTVLHKEPPNMAGQLNSHHCGIALETTRRVYSDKQRQRRTSHCKKNTFFHKKQIHTKKKNNISETKIMRAYTKFTANKSFRQNKIAAKKEDTKLSAMYND